MVLHLSQRLAKLFCTSFAHVIAMAFCHYRPQTKLREGNDFTPVWDSVHREEGFSVQGVSVLTGSLSRGVCFWGGLCHGDPFLRYWVVCILVTVRNEVAKVMFLHLSVILFTGEGLPQCMLGYHPPHPDQVPLDQAPPRTRHPRSRPPRAGTPLNRHHSRTSPPLYSAWEIRSTSGRYASYWNAILLAKLFCNQLCSCNRNCLLSFIMLLMSVIIKCHNIVNDIMNDILNNKKLSQYL